MSFSDFYCNSQLSRTRPNYGEVGLKLTIGSFFFTFGLLCFAFLIGVYFNLWLIAGLSQWAYPFGMLSALAAMFSVPSIDYRVYANQREAGNVVMPPLVQAELDKRIGLQK